MWYLETCAMRTDCFQTPTNRGWGFFFFFLKCYILEWKCCGLSLCIWEGFHFAISSRRMGWKIQMSKDKNKTWWFMECCVVSKTCFNLIEYFQKGKKKKKDHSRTRIEPGRKAIQDLNREDKHKGKLRCWRKPFCLMPLKTFLYCFLGYILYKIIP